MESINATSLRRKSGQWGTQPLLLVQGVGVKAAVSDYLEFPMSQQQKVGYHSGGGTESAQVLDRLSTKA
jgi:hypothetical protein